MSPTEKKTWQDIVALAEHYKAIGYTDQHLYGVGRKAVAA